MEIWVIDSGIRHTHEDFDGRASVELDTYGDDVSHLDVSSE